MYTICMVARKYANYFYFLSKSVPLSISIDLSTVPTPILKRRKSGRETLFFAPFLSRYEKKPYLRAYFLHVRNLV